MTILERAIEAWRKEQGNVPAPSDIPALKAVLGAFYLDPSSSAEDYE